MTSRNVVITGANSGIGFEAAKHFAANGAQVIMACRSLDKAEKAQGDIQAAVADAKTVIMKLDVSDLESVREFGQQFSTRHSQLDVLINNAGIVAIPLTRNNSGHEMQLATNYLGPFALTGTLLPFFPDDRPTRIVNVGSLMHLVGKLGLDDFNWENTPYDQWAAYGRSKVAMMSFTLELNRRLQQAGKSIIALGAHPGFANTNIYNNSPALQQRKSTNQSWLTRKMESLVPKPESAAQPIIFAAESAAVKGGDYYGPGGIMETGIFGKPGRARIKKIARNQEVAKRLWTISEEITGVSYLSGF